MSRIAIIGGGITGLGCAHFLQRDFEVTLFEEENRLGGHANTVFATEPGTGTALPIDTGFMVFNQVTYPLLTRLFTELQVPIKPASMSFAVRDDATGLEWCGSSLNHLFSQRKNLFRPRFLRMLWQIDRFNREALVALQDPATAKMTLREYVTQRGYGHDFCQLYILPMSSAVWSTPPALMLEFPASTLLRFFFNHGFLGLHTQHPWLTVDGGSREYVARLTASFVAKIQRGVGARRIVRHRDGVEIASSDGQTQNFDRVVIATQADQALSLLGDPTPAESRLLSCFKYQSNVATLHTDSSVMPRTRRAWASWNYQMSLNDQRAAEPATHYWMNSLQGVSTRQNYFVSINGANTIAPASVLKTLAYRHPLFDLAATQAQTELADLNRQAPQNTRTFFGGSYTRYGFHEDGLKSAYDLSALLLGRDPWLDRSRALSSDLEISATNRKSTTLATAI